MFFFCFFSFPVRMQEEDGTKPRFRKSARAPAQLFPTCHPSTTSGHLQRTNPEDAVIHFRPCTDRHDTHSLIEGPSHYKVYCVTFYHYAAMLFRLSGDIL